MDQYQPIEPIYHIISSFHPLIGGVERATQNLCRELAVNTNIAILTRYCYGRLRHELIEGIRVHRLGSGGKKFIGSLTFILHSLFRLILKRKGCRIVHVQNIDSPLLIGILAKVLTGKKLVITLQGEKTIIQRKATSLGRLRVWLMARLGDRFVAITRESRRQFLVEGIAPDRIWDIPNGIDTDYFCPPTTEQKIALRKHFCYLPDESIVLYMGRLVDLKRVDMLIKAFRPFKDKGTVRCIIVGDGPEMKKLEALVQSEGLSERVHLMGSTNAVLSYYQIADIFVLPSLYEGLSVALLEAMACGLCVIVAGSPGNLDVVEHGVNGLVFPVDMPKILKTRLAETLTDTEGCHVLGQAARQTIMLSHSIKAIARAHVEMYKALQGA